MSVAALVRAADQTVSSIQGGPKKPSPYIVLFASGGSRGGSLGSDEPPPPSGRVWWLKTLELHGCIKVVQ